MAVKSVFSACVILILFHSAMATSMFELSLQELSVLSEKVVQARVTAIVTQWDKEGEMLYTYIRMNIQDDLLGDDEDNEIIIKMVGGSDGKIKLDVEGNAVYSIGEENILFLFNDPANITISQTLGMYQGKYRIFTDENNVIRVVQEPNSDGVVLKKRSKNTAGNTGSNFTLKEFKETILMHRKNSEK